MEGFSKAVIDLAERIFNKRHRTEPPTESSLSWLDCVAFADKSHPYYHCCYEFMRDDCLEAAIAECN